MDKSFDGIYRQLQSIKENSQSFIKAQFNKYNVTNFTEIPETAYPAIVEEIKNLGVVIA